MLSETTLRLLNSTALTAMSNVITTNIGRINRRVSNARARLTRLTGQHQQYNSNGNPRLYSSPNSGNRGAEHANNKLSTLKSSIDTMSILLNSGYEVFSSGRPGGNLGDMIQQARNELYTQFPQPTGNTKAYANNKVRRIYNGYIRIRQELADMNSTVDLIYSILKERASISFSI